MFCTIYKCRLSCRGSRWSIVLEEISEKAVESIITSQGLGEGICIVGCGVNFVDRSYFAWCCLTKWYANAMCFLFNGLPGLVALSTTPMLSTQMGVDLQTITPIDRRWYCKVTAASSCTALFKAVNGVCCSLWLRLPASTSTGDGVIFGLLRKSASFVPIYFSVA